MLAAGALVASLLAVSASPVGAATDEADYTTKLSACVGDALDDQGFTDVSDDHAFGDAINCIAYYDITNGTGDGSTYSPNQDVTRAQMAVFIARAAKAAGVELKSGSGGFTDIDDVWEESQDAINGLAASGMISKGGAYRPDDAVTRAEMASFLIGLLNKAAPNVTIDSAGAIKLGSGSAAMEADDYFADARSALPRANDAEVSAIYELGITKGASAAAVQDDTKPPLDFNYEPHGTVDRGQMAAFITRALAHTSVRPSGVSAQFDGSNVVVSVRDDNYQPRANVVVDVFRTDTSGVDLAFRANGSCAEVSKIGPNVGDYVCEIDGTDPITNGDGEATIELDGGVDEGGTTAWAWTGDNEDKVDDDTSLFRLDIAKTEQTSPAARARVSTDFAGKKAHLGSSVLYTVQLEDSNGKAATVGTDGKKPAQFLVTLSTYALVPDPGDATDLDRNPQGASVVSTLPLTTDADGKATFSVSGLPDPAPAVKGDKYAVDIMIQARQNGNGPAAIHIGTAEAAATPGATGLVTVRAAADDDNYSAALVFSTEASSREADDLTVAVKSAADFVAASARGANNRVTATVTDQYGDPIAGAKVVFTSSLSTETPAVTIQNGRALAVARDGSITVGYQRTLGTQASETVTASWNHDDDDGTTDPITGTAAVEWALVADNVGADATGTDQIIREFDTETNTIFVSSTATSTADAVMLTYDSTDRFDVGVSGSESASSYATFERSLAKGLALDWTITGTGSRATNTFELTTTS